MEEENTGGGGGREKKKGRVAKYETQFAEFADERHLMYRASFRAEWLQRFGVGSCNCVGFGCAKGGMVFGEVGQAGGREEVTLAAGTV